MKIYQFKNNTDQYFIGTVINEFNRWLVLQTIDEHGNLGGLEFLKKDQFKTIDEAKEITFHKSLADKKITADSFQLAK